MTIRPFDVDTLVPRDAPDEERSATLIAAIRAKLGDHQAALAVCSSRPEFGQDPKLRLDIVTAVADLVGAWLQVETRLVRRDRVEWRMPAHVRHAAIKAKVDRDRAVERAMHDAATTD